MTRESDRDVSRRQFLIGSGAAGVSALALAGCTEQSGTTTSGSGSGLSGEINVSGSSTVYPLAVEVANEFEADHPEVSIPIKKTGSGGGFSNHFCVGNAAINNASRPIKESEKELCADNDIEYHQIKVATDAVTVIVNNDNDWIDCLTVEQLGEIWREDGASKWSDLNDDWPSEPINRFGAADTSGTFDYFTETIIGEEGNHTTNYSATEQDNQILSGVQQDQYAIGYFGFAYYVDNTDKVTALAIDDGDGCVKPSLETAKSGEYKPLSRPLFTYPSKSALEREEVAEFCRFFVEKSADQELVADTVGYVPNTEEAMQSQLEDLNAVIDEVQ